MGGDAGTKDVWTDQVCSAATCVFDQLQDGDPRTEANPGALKVG